MKQPPNLFNFFIKEIGNVFSKKYFYLNSLAEKILKIKKNNQDEEKFWNIFFLIMENDELKNFKIFRCGWGLCNVSFTFSMLNKLKLKNKINEDDWSAIVSRIFSEVNNIHNKCLVNEKYFLNNKKSFLIMYKNVLRKQKEITEIQIIRKKNPNFVEKNLNIKKLTQNNEDLISLWNSGKYDDVIEKLKEEKDITVKSIFDIEGKNGINKFFNEKLKKVGFNEDKFLWKEINTIFESLSKIRNKSLKKTIRQTEDTKIHPEAKNWNSLPVNVKKSLSRVLLDIYLLGQNFLYLNKDEEN